MLRSILNQSSIFSGLRRRSYAEQAKLRHYPLANQRFLRSVNICIKFCFKCSWEDCIFLGAFENNNCGEGWGRQTEDLSSLEAFSFPLWRRHIEKSVFSFRQVLTRQWEIFCIKSAQGFLSAARRKSKKKIFQNLYFLIFNFARGFQ